MFRFLGLVVVFAAVSAAFHYSYENFPDDGGLATVRLDGNDAPGEIAFGTPSPVETLNEAIESSEIVAAPSGRRWVPGVYAIGDSLDPDIADYDRDYRARRSIFDEDALAELRDEGDDSEDDESEDDSGEDLEDDADDEREDDEDDERDEDEDENDTDGEGEQAFGPDYSPYLRGELTPGLYATEFDTRDCSYQLWRVSRKRNDQMIGEEYLTQGRLLATINGIEPDWFTSSESCGHWVEWQPLVEPLTRAGNGDYWIDDLVDGEWFVPENCQWEEVSGFRGGLLRDVIESGSGPGTMTVDELTYGLRIRNCTSPMTLLTPADR